MLSARETPQRVAPAAALGAPSSRSAWPRLRRPLHALEALRQPGLRRPRPGPNAVAAVAASVCFATPAAFSLRNSHSALRVLVTRAWALTSGGCVLRWEPTRRWSCLAGGSQGPPAGLASQVRPRGAAGTGLAPGMRRPCRFAAGARQARADGRRRSESGDHRWTPQLKPSSAAVRRYSPTRPRYHSNRRCLAPSAGALRHRGAPAAQRSSRPRGVRARGRGTRKSRSLEGRGLDHQQPLETLP
mmetsp:Transcript_31730/g.87645  ORF Transcript_31730/g.87645 Transcript_31730/m.87645 type:complete len:244 (+) Transcript_31730:870-1601(+)